MKQRSGSIACILTALSIFCATTSHAMITEIREFHNPIQKKSAALAVDVEAFLSQCKTLPRA